eukprot:939251-Amphidinium_carterae.1
MIRAAGACHTQKARANGRRTFPRQMAPKEEEEVSKCTAILAAWFSRKMCLRSQNETRASTMQSCTGQPPG